MFLAIFGAGASRDAVPPPELEALPSEWRPPLTNELFTGRNNFRAIASQWDDAVRLIQRMRRLPTGVSVEERLEQLYERAEGDEELDRELMALRMYLQEVLWTCGAAWQEAAHGISNYGDVVTRVGEWRRRGAFESALYLTFNYDTLLDSAVIGRRISSIDQYWTNPVAPLVKIHGSVNWGRRMTSHTRYGGDTRAVTITDWRRWQLSDDWEIIKSLENSADMWPVMPQLAVPMQSKAEFICPPKLIETLTTGLPKASRVLIVGWGAVDEPFVRLMAQKIAPGTPFHVVSERSPATIVDRLQTGGVRGRFTAVPGGFTKYLDEPEHLDALASGRAT